MGAFGGETTKPHKLMSNRWWIHGMERARPRHMPKSQTATITVAPNGSKQVTGNAKELKETQHYTDEFGQAFAERYMSYRSKYAEVLKDDDFDLLSPRPVSYHAWEDLDMNGALEQIHNELCRAQR